MVIYNETTPYPKRINSVPVDSTDTHLKFVGNTCVLGPVIVLEGEDTNRGTCWHKGSQGLFGGPDRRYDEIKDSRVMTRLSTVEEPLLFG